MMLPMLDCGFILRDPRASPSTRKQQMTANGFRTSFTALPVEEHTD